MFHKSLQAIGGEEADRGFAMAPEPKFAQSGGGTDDPTSVPPKFSDSLKSENGTLDDRVGSLDARAQSALLQEAFEAPPTPGSESPTRQRTGFSSKWTWRVVKSAVGLAIVFVVGVGPMQRLFEFSSVDAVVNARLVSLRAPIDGKLEAGPVSPTVGASAARGIALLRITNTRADRTRLEDLRRLIDQIDSERSSIAGRLGRLKELHKDIEEQTRAFQEGRIQELEARVMDFKAQAEAASATQVEATSTLERTKALAASGAQTKVVLERAHRDATIAIETERSIRHRLFAAEVELEASRRGQYIGDTYNDRPSSRQQADELSIRIAETEGELSARDRRLDALQADLRDQNARYADLSDVVLSSPIDAQIWEILVSPGEEVRRGQDLLRLLDCSGTVVTTTVSESVYNQLRIGNKAQFRFTNQSKLYGGQIIRTSGVASPPDNLAIQSTGPSSAAYRVTVSVPELASGQCGVGRTGKVVFQAGAGSSGIMDFIWHGLSIF
jgi:multidrug resistance efflux pump